MSIPVSVAVASEQPGTFRKMALVDAPASTAMEQAIWKTPERHNSEPSMGAKQPGAPVRPRLNTAPLAKEHSPPRTTVIPLATSTPERHPIFALATSTVTPPPRAASTSSDHFSVRHGDGGGDWTKMDDTVDPELLMKTSRADRCIPPDIPAKQRKNFGKLLEYLKSFRDVEQRPPISPSDHGELVTDKILRGTSYADVLRALYTNSRYETAGLCDAVAALHKANAPADLLGSRRALDLFQLGGHTVAQRGAGSAGTKAAVAAPPGRAPRILRVYK
jgi:hypothetical protein